jgi:GDP-L-fucose synthase
MEPVTTSGLDKGTPVYVAGHRGLVGSAIWRLLSAQGFNRLIGRTSREVDLRNREATFELFQAERPQVVIVAAARVGGIGANSRRPVDFLSDNVRIQTNVLDAALEVRTPRLLFLGSSCIYPKFAPQPIPESALLTGPLEPTNDAYAIAKIAGIAHVQAVRRQYGLPWISAMPTNLYGPGDNFDIEDAHVLPALIRRFDDAVASGQPEVQIWGTGKPRREFLHVDDLAAACLHLLERYDAPEPINVGWGVDVSIRELAEMVAATVGFTGTLSFDASRPDGTPRKVLDTSRLTELGWRPAISLEAGLSDTYKWFASNRDAARGLVQTPA